MSPLAPEAPGASPDRPWARSRLRAAPLTLITGCALAACQPDAEVPPEPTVIDDAGIL